VAANAGLQEADVRVDRDFRQELCSRIAPESYSCGGTRPRASAVDRTEPDLVGSETRFELLDLLPCVGGPLLVRREHAAVLREPAQPRPPLAQIRTRPETEAKAQDSHREVSARERHERAVGARAGFERKSVELHRERVEEARSGMPGSAASRGRRTRAASPARDHRSTISSRVPSSEGCGVDSVFSSLALELASTLPQFNRLFLWFALLVSGVGAIFVVAGRVGIGNSTVQAGGLVLIACLLVVSAHLALRGHAPARLFLVAFGLFFVAANLAPRAEIRVA